MPTPLGKTLLIANPAAQNGNGAARPHMAGARPFFSSTAAPVYQKEGQSDGSME